VGVLGSFASLMLRYPGNEGIAFLLGAIIATVANDVGAFFVGRQVGRTPLAPAVSPNKTLEGTLGGALVSAVVCVLVVSRISPWDVGGALALALVVAVVAPLGDLCESMVKRDIGVKDMGSLLPGHGGVLDRFDALLFVLPAVYYLVELLNLPGQ
jgi:phosphatidate cytidylyltransferase